VAARAAQRGFPLSTLEADRASLEAIFAALTTVEADDEHEPAPAAVDADADAGEEAPRG
jgi:hypothetical protein